MSCELTYGIFIGMPVTPVKRRPNRSTSTGCSPNQSSLPRSPPHV